MNQNLFTLIRKFAFILLAAVPLLSLEVQAELPAKFNKAELEMNVLKKFISLQSEYDVFYRISSVEITETEDNTYHLPGYVIQINYSTPECPNNYFKGLAYSAMCTDEECPFGKVYKNCY